MLFEKAIAVTERHKSQAIHFHLLGIMAGRADIRTGFRHDVLAACRKTNRPFTALQVGAGPRLQALWAFLRDKLPEYGFGRAQLTPVEKTGAAIAGYVAKYIEKNVANRVAADRGKKMVRYIGWEKTQLKANEFEWNGAGAKKWREKAKAVLEVVDCRLSDKPLPDREVRSWVREACVRTAGAIRPKMLDGSEAMKFLGEHWAFHVSRLIEIDAANCANWGVGFQHDFEQRLVFRRELLKLNPAWSSHVRKSRWILEEREFLAFKAGFPLQSETSYEKN
jgi:hypothetical protein